ncbi:MAG: hypothetical protein WA948_08745 [Pontixanthobacter sp.]
MTDHPSTYKGDPSNTGAIQWNDRAALHRKDDPDGLLDGASSLRRGSFAELIRHMMLLPEEDRGKYQLEKAGDREYSADEVAELYARDDFPKADNLS